MLSNRNRNAQSETFSTQFVLVLLGNAVSINALSTLLRTISTFFFFSFFPRLFATAWLQLSCKDFVMVFELGKRCFVNTYWPKSIERNPTKYRRFYFCRQFEKIVQL